MKMNKNNLLSYIFSAIAIVVVVVYVAYYFMSPKKTERSIIVPLSEQDQALVGAVVTGTPLALPEEDEKQIDDIISAPVVPMTPAEEAFLKEVTGN